MPEVAVGELPARGTFTKDRGEKAPRTCFIVQAEIQPDGQLRYGIIETHRIRAIIGDERANVRRSPSSRRRKRSETATA